MLFFEMRHLYISGQCQIAGYLMMTFYEFHLICVIWYTPT